MLCPKSLARDIKLTSEEIERQGNKTWVDYVWVGKSLEFQRKSDLFAQGASRAVGVFFITIISEELKVIRAYIPISMCVIP